MDIITTELVPIMQKHAREKYDISFEKKREATLASAQGCFTKIQDYFKKYSKFPSYAYSRTINYPGEPDELEKTFLQEMGFELGKTFKTSDGSRDRCEYTYTQLLIPKNEEGIPLTTAQRLYEEHRAKINEILADVLKEDANWLGSKSVFFAQKLISDLENGVFEGDIISAEPHHLKISLKRKVPHSIPDRTECLERFVYNLLVSKGILVENGFSKLKCECSGHWEHASFEIKMVVQLSD